jgi:hypothetical protein
MSDHYCTAFKQNLCKPDSTEAGFAVTEKFAAISSTRLIYHIPEDEVDVCFFGNTVGLSTALLLSYFTSTFAISQKFHMGSPNASWRRAVPHFIQNIPRERDDSVFMDDCAPEDVYTSVQKKTLASLAFFDQDVPCRDSVTKHTQEIPTSSDNSCKSGSENLSDSLS